MICLGILGLIIGLIPILFLYYVLIYMALRDDHYREIGKKELRERYEKKLKSKGLRW